MLLRRGTRPQWWLEGSSYPIRVLDRKRVQVLAHSAEMGRRYGASPVVVRFRWEDGEVIHVVSHFYRQVAARGPQVAAADAVGQFQGLSDKDRAEFKASGAGGAKVADVESSYAFQRMTANLVTGKQKRNKELERRYDRTVRSAAPMRAQSGGAGPVVAQGRKGTRMRVLQKKGDEVQVRDELGNEGWVPAGEMVAY